MNKAAVLNELRTSRAKLVSAIEGLPEEAMLRAGVVGLWSIKDLLAHLTAWESELVTALARLAVSRKIPHIVEIDDLDEWNMEVYAVNARRALSDVLEDFQGVHKHLLKAVEEIDEKTLTNPRRFPWMEGEPLSYLIAENGFWHESEHADQILEWRKTNGV
ncbi:MAG: ClbS/DfsB family four-helix bundle protein [Anaerolineae bacterium]|nr:ClbS/DfsB family four-helix bundle protein [Anaerolineae bacterium]